MKNVVQINEKIEGKEEQLIKKIKAQQGKIMDLEEQIRQISKSYGQIKLKLDESQILVKELEQRLACQGGISFFPPFQSDYTQEQSEYEVEPYYSI